MKQLTLMAVVLVFLLGCEKIDDPLALAKANYKCEKHGGVYKIEVNKIRQSGVEITCKDGFIFSYTREYFSRIRGKGVLKHMNKSEATVTVPQFNLEEK